MLMLKLTKFFGFEIWCLFFVSTLYPRSCIRCFICKEGSRISVEVFRVITRKKALAFSPWLCISKVVEHCANLCWATTLVSAFESGTKVRAYRETGLFFPLFPFALLELLYFLLTSTRFRNWWRSCNEEDFVLSN